MPVVLATWEGDMRGFFLSRDKKRNKQNMKKWPSHSALTRDRTNYKPFLKDSKSTQGFSTSALLTFGIR